MKQIDKHTLLAFLGPFVVSLLVILFILVMQFMALYLNDIASRQPSPVIIGKLFFYASGRLVLTAMPVALLAGALMAFGNLGEFNELASMKSCGISLLKIMRSVVFFTFCLTMTSLWISFDLIPKANLKFFSLLYDVQRKKPDLAIKPGHFYSDIDGYVIRVSDKNPKSGTLFDVMIYNHSENRGNNDIIIADSARMKSRGGTLSMVLYEGIRYEEYKPETGKPDNRPHGRTYFDSLYYRFRLEGFELSRTDESLFRHQITLPYKELTNAMDSIGNLRGKQLVKNTQQVGRYNKIDTNFMVYTVDTLPNQRALVSRDFDRESNVLVCFKDKYPEDIVNRSITNARAVKSYVEFMVKKKSDQDQTERKYNYEFYFRYALPFNCLVFVLIGISLGAIIRKGGLGVPALLSLGFFMVFYVLTTQGKKLSKEDIVEPWVGAWLSVLIFGPVALVLVWQATMDAKLLNESFWGSVRDRITNLFRAKVQPKIKEHEVDHEEVPLAAAIPIGASEDHASSDSVYVCQDTGETYPLDEIRWRSNTGQLMDLQVVSSFDPAMLSDQPQSLWRYASAFPAMLREHRVSMGEGFTPLVKHQIAGKEVFLKWDHLFPSGSYKDRGATVLMSLAKALGVSQVVQDSSGNAGCAIAQYAAMAGIDCEIFVPTSTSPGKLVQIAAYGATVTKVPGSREDTASAAKLAAETRFYASHVWHPMFYQGTKTFAYEICEQLGWRAPDTVILPAGNGTLLLGAEIGFTELKNQGIISHIPKLVGIQAANCAPLYEAFQHGREEVSLFQSDPTIAEGIAIALPLRGPQMLSAVRGTGGTILVVEEEEIQHALVEMVQQGQLIEPTSAAVIAGVKQYASAHAQKDELIVSVITGHGLKASDKIGKLMAV